jgi:6,7-dimethyl-8-ribityllumazine synthase
MMSVKSKPELSTDYPFLKKSPKLRIAIVFAEWNPVVSQVLKNAAYDHLIENGLSPEQILVKSVPGSYELPLAAQWLAEHANMDAVICLGTIIKGETRHDEYIASAVAQKLSTLSLKFSKPFIFGVLTTENEEQAQARAGGNKGNKGEEAASAALKMLQLQYDLTH